LKRGCALCKAAFSVKSKKQKQHKKQKVPAARANAYTRVGTGGRKYDGGFFAPDAAVF
jgi:hypothetical protein